MKKYNSFNDLPSLKETFEKGGVIAFPTDTVFGLACIYDDEKAIEKLKAIKKRDAHKPLPMMCANISMMKEVAIMSSEAIKVADSFFPGPLTLILKRRDEVPSFVTNGFATIGIRIPNHEGILKLIEYIGKPLLVTSANISNEPALKYYKDVENSLKEIDGIIEMDAESELASTIVDMTDGIKILRKGLIKEEDIKRVLGR